MVRDKKIKVTKHQKKLLEDYEKGLVLQVDKDIDNKQYLSSQLDKKEEVKQEVKEEPKKQEGLNSIEYSIVNGDVVWGA